jgi:hypothetical protein
MLLSLSQNLKISWYQWTRTITMIEVLQIVFGVILISVMGYGCWISSVMLTERSKLRKYTGEYYDFDIDTKLKEMGLTREQALKYFDD